MDVINRAIQNYRKRGQEEIKKRIETILIQDRVKCIMLTLSFGPTHSEALENMIAIISVPGE